MRKGPPNLLACRACKHEWAAKTWSTCPECSSDQLRVMCGAKARSGKPCRANRESGSNRCRLHGGKSLVGPAAPSFKSGQRSELLPERYRLAYERSLADPNQLRGGKDVALLDARRAELLSRLSTGESREAWRTLQKLLRELRDQVKGEKATKLLDAAYELVEEALADEATWGQIGEVLDQRRRTVDVEVKRVKAERDYIPMETMMAMVYGITMASREMLEGAVRGALAAAEVGVEDKELEGLVSRGYSDFARKLRELSAGATLETGKGD